MIPGAVLVVMPVGPTSAHTGEEGVPKFSYSTPVSEFVQKSCEFAVVGAVFWK